MNFEDQGKAISDDLLISRTSQAAVKVAQAVMAESAAADGHEQRAEFARIVLSSPVNQAEKLVRAVANNSNFGAGGQDDPRTSDSALEFVITSIWNAYAGYSANP